MRDLSAGRLISVFAIQLLWAGALTGLAQPPTGTVAGTVLDESRAVVPGAAVGLVNEASADTRRTETNDRGYFSLMAIPAGTYTLEIERPGFAAWKRTGIFLRPGDRILVPELVLQVGGTAETITVGAERSHQLSTNSGEKSGIITARQIEELPVLGRSAGELLRILPGVVQTTTGFPGEKVTFESGLSGMHVAGGRSQGGIAILSDGIDVIDPGCDCNSAVTPNVDLVSEVKIQVASFSADQAKGPVVLQTVSRSGGAEYHGEAYLLWRNDAFNSRGWMSHYFDSPKPDEQYLFPGFNLGGPLTRDRQKAFFFLGFEWMDQRYTEGDRPAVVPTAKMRQGDFTEVCTGELQLYGYNGCPVNDFWGNWTDPGFPGLENGVIDPSLFDPGGKALINLYPLPNREPGANPDRWNYLSNPRIGLDRDQELVRLDWTISDNTRLYTRLNHELERRDYPYSVWTEFAQPVPSPSLGTGQYESWSTAAGISRVLSPTATNEVIVGATVWRLSHRLEDPAALSKTATGYPYHGVFDSGVDMIPSVHGGAMGLAAIAQLGGLLDPGIFANKLLLSAEDHFSKVLDTHTLKAGLRWEGVWNDEPTADMDQGIFSVASWGDNGTGNAYADLLLGRIADFSQSTTNPVGYLRRQEFSAYLQDSWRAASRLTLDLGVRFEHNGFFHDKGGWMSGFDPAAYDPDAPLEKYSGLVAPALGDDVPQSIWKSPGMMVSPRLGFAWDLGGRGRTVLRGGAGVYRYHGRGGDSLSGFGNPPLQLDAYLCCGFFLGEIDRMAASLVLKPSIAVLEPRADTYPATYSFSLTVSRRLPRDLFWETSYVGNTSSHQLADCGLIREFNAIPEGTMPVGSDNEADYRPYQSFNRICMKGHNLSQNYHSLQTIVSRQTGAIAFTGSYTFGKAMGVGGAAGEYQPSAFDVRGRGYGPLSYDRTHVFSLGFSLRLPNLAGSRGLAEGLLNDWQLTGISRIQSGGRIGILAMGGTRSDGGSAADDIDISGTPDVDAIPRLVCDPRDGRRPGEWFNPRCFEAPSIGNNGDYAWPYFKGPGWQNHDLSVFKNWRVGSGEDRKLQIRASLFNFLNHPQPVFTGDELTLIFENGILTDDYLARANVGRTSLKQGRRIAQFALKFLF